MNINIVYGWTFGNVVFTLILEIINVMDMYIRLHVQYYNDMGILVTNPFCTAKHYLQTSFTVDVLATFPYAALSVPDIFSRRYLHLSTTIMMTVTRSLQLYKINGGINVIQQNLSLSKCQIIETIKYSGLLILMCGLLINICLLLSCHYFHTKEGLKIACSDTSWLGMAKLAGTKDNDVKATVLESMYLIVMAIGKISTNSIFVYDPKEIIWVLFLYVLGSIMKMCLLGKVASYSVSVLE